MDSVDLDAFFAANMGEGPDDVIIDEVAIRRDKFKAVLIQSLTLKCLLKQTSPGFAETVRFLGDSIFITRNVVPHKLEAALKAQDLKALVDLDMSLRVIK